MAIGDARRIGAEDFSDLPTMCARWYAWFPGDARAPTDELADAARRAAVAAELEEMPFVIIVRQRGTAKRLRDGGRGEVIVRDRRRTL